MRKSLPWKVELRRKLFHLFWVVLALFMYIGVDKWGRGVVRNGLLALLFVFIFFDFLRVECRWRFFGSIIRSKERGMFCGASTAMLGIVIVFALADLNVAVLSTLFMGVGDLVAGVVRQRVGHHRFLKKTWEDFLAGGLSSTIAGLLLVQLPWLVILMALAAQLVENLTSILDDNVLMVLSAGLVGQALISFV